MQWLCKVWILLTTNSKTDNWNTHSWSPQHQLHVIWKLINWTPHEWHIEYFGPWAPPSYYAAIILYTIYSSAAYYISQDSSRKTESAILADRQSREKSPFSRSRSPNYGNKKDVGILILIKWTCWHRRHYDEKETGWEALIRSCTSCASNASCDANKLNVGLSCLHTCGCNVDDERQCTFMINFIKMVSFSCSRLSLGLGWIWIEVFERYRI